MRIVLNTEHNGPITVRKSHSDPRDVVIHHAYNSIYLEPKEAAEVLAALDLVISDGEPDEEGEAA